MDTSSVNTTHTPATSLDPAVQQALNDVGFTSRKTATTLTSDDFLKLLTVQLQNQDPLKPMEDAQFMGQMAQFASLEQTRDLNTSFSKFTKAQSLATASQFLDKQVTINDPNGVVTGIVSDVNITDDGAKIVVTGTQAGADGNQVPINGIAYATDAVTSVRNPLQ
ncbi:MAG: flagellar hook capping FlgD N-terminal domain-containing protein [Verrucomicrobiota bacterium]